MILAVNTATPQFSLALLTREGQVLAEVLMSGGKGHFANLMPALQWMLRSSERNIREVTCVSVATGPGSFTGLRIGISLGKGLSHALNATMVAVSSLEAMAIQVPFVDVPVVPILHSRKGEVFAARFVWENNRQLKRVLEDTWVRWEDLPRLFHESAFLVGNDYRQQGTPLKELLNNRAVLAPPHCWCPRASSVGSLALDRLLEGDGDDPSSLQPVYLRPPDIRPNPFAAL